jgi:predicted enzyme related to lactoylglutathione lyase
MLSDEYPEVGPGVVSPTTLGGTPFSMHLDVPDVDAVHARVVADGRAVVGRPPHDEPYGARSFDVLDPFGHRWMIQTPIATPTVEEIEAGMEGYTITTAAPASAEAPVEIGYVTFGSPDTRTAARFYGALFGWAAEPGPSGDEYAHVANTELPMGLAPGTVTEAPVIYFRVDDIARYTARVRELGGEVISEATYDSGPNAVCADDQGRQFQLWQPAPGY